MNGKFAPAIIVVVHCRQIVVDKRIVVDKFNRNRKAHDFVYFGVFARRARAVIHAKRTHSFPAVESGIAHTLVDDVIVISYRVFERLFERKKKFVLSMVEIFIISRVSILR